MTDEPAPPGTELDPWELEWTINRRMLKTPFALPAAPPKLMTLIGSVAASWAQFDQLFTDYFDRLVTHNGTASDWALLRGDKRFRRFRQEVGTAFPGSSGIATFAATLTTEAKALGKVRHTLLHGAMAFRFYTSEDGQRRSSVVAASRSGTKGNFDRVELDEYGLNVVFHQLCHLAGRTSAIMNGPSQLGLSSDDTQTLQAFAESSRQNYRRGPPTLPILATPQDPPRSSPG